MIPETKKLYTFDGNKVYFKEGWQEKLAEIGLADDCSWTTLEPGEPVSITRNVCVYRYRLRCGTTIYFKRYVYDNCSMEFFLRPSKAANEVFGFANLQKAGIPTLTAVASGEIRKWGTLLSTFIVTVGVENSMNLEDYAFNVWYQKSPEEKKRIYKIIATQIISQLHLAHKISFFHYDLKWRNVLVAEENNSLCITWIDCPRSRFLKLRHRKGVIVDISALSRLALSYLSKTERLRFLIDYMGSPARDEWKSMWRDVHRHLSKRMPKPVDLSSLENPPE